MGLFSSKENGRLDETNEDIEKSEKGKYIVRVICKNCRFKEKVAVPQNTSVKNFLKNVACSKCGLKELKMMQNQSNEEWFGDFLDDNSFDEDEEELKKKGKIELNFIVDEEDLKEVEKFMAELMKKKAKKNSKKK